MSERSDTDKLLELLTTVAVLFLYWISTQPEWKLQYYLTLIQTWITRNTTTEDTTETRILNEFKREISEWEASEKRGNAGPR